MTTLKIRSLIALVLTALALSSINTAQGAELLATDRRTNQIFAYNTDGTFNRVLVNSTQGLSTPSSMAIGFDGDLFVSNIGTGEILRFDAATGASLGVFATTAAPGGLYFDSATSSLLVGTLTPAATGPIVYNSAGVATPIVTSNVGMYSGMTTGPNGDLFAAQFFSAPNYQSSSIVRFDRSNDFATGTLYADATLGGAQFAGANQPIFGSDGNLYVTSLYGQTLTKFTLDTNGDLVAGASVGGLPYASGLVAWGDNLLVSTLGNDVTNDPIYGGFTFSGDIQLFNVATQSFSPFITFATSGSTDAQGFFQPTSLIVSPVPEPTSLAMASFALVGGALWYARKRRHG